MSQNRAFANQEREYQARRLGKLGRGALMTLATLLPFIALSLFGIDQLYRPDTFRIEQLKITGQFRYIDPANIEAAIIDQASGNFFSLNLESIKNDVERMSWVESVDIRREWPGTLILSVREHRPAMRWGKNKWLSTAGAVIELPESIEANHIIKLNGSESQAKRILLQAAHWKAELIKHGLELRGVELSESEAWTLQVYFQNQNAEFDLLLGHEEVDKRLQRFQFLFNKQFRFSEHALKRVDARYPDGLAVQQSEATLSNSRAMSGPMTIALNNEY